MNNFLPVRACVIIVSHNSRKHLEYGLPGILASLGENDEVIIVDNSSEDDGPAWVEQNYPQILVINSKVNLGFGSGNNLGAQAARGEFLVFLNPDVSVDSGWLDALLSPLMSEPQTGMVTSKILLLDQPDCVNACGNDVHLSGLTLCRGMGMPSGNYLQPEEVAAVSGAAFAMRRKEFLELDGFDESFFMYMEDTDLSMRVRLAGMRILFAPGSVVWHAYQLRFGLHKVYYQERNRYQMIIKVLRWRTIVAMVPMLVFAELITLGFVLLRERARFGNKIRACGWVFSHWNEILLKRKRVQSLRRISDRQLLSMMSPRLDFEQVEPKGWLKFILSILNLTSAPLARLTLAMVR